MTTPFRKPKDRRAPLVQQLPQAMINPGLAQQRPRHSSSSYPSMPLAPASPHPDLNPRLAAPAVAGQTHRGARIMVYVAIGLSMLTVAGLCLSFVLQSPIGFAVGIPTALIYLGIGLAAFRLTPMWPTPSVGLTLAAMGWGSGFATTAIFSVSGVWSEITTKLGIPAAEMSFAGAYPEEIIKAAGVAVFLLCFPQLTKPWHGFVVGGLIGLGFDTFENLGYAVIFGMLDPNSDAAGAAQVWTLRIIAGPYMHVILSAIAGYGIAWAMFSDKRTKTGAPIGLGHRLGFALGAFAISFSTHFWWNFEIANFAVNIVLLVVLSLIIYPLFIALWVRCYRDAKADKEEMESNQGNQGTQGEGDKASASGTAAFTSAPADLQPFSPWQIHTANPPSGSTSPQVDLPQMLPAPTDPLKR